MARDNAHARRKHRMAGNRIVTVQPGGKHLTAAGGDRVALLVAAEHRNCHAADVVSACLVVLPAIPPVVVQHGLRNLAEEGRGGSKARHVVARHHGHEEVRKVQYQHASNAVLRLAGQREGKAQQVGRRLDPGTGQGKGVRHEGDLCLGAQARNVRRRRVQGHGSVVVHDAGEQRAPVVGRDRACRQLKGVRSLRDVQRVPLAAGHGEVQRKPPRDAVVCGRLAVRSVGGAVRQEPLLPHVQRLGRLVPPQVYHRVAGRGDPPAHLFANVHVGGLAERPPQVLRDGVAVRVRCQVLLQAGAHHLAPQPVKEHGQDSGTLAVRDGVEDLLNILGLLHDDLDGVGGHEGVQLERFLQFHGEHVVAGVA
mmetsp:Transcript_11545/g.36677  ORF Transcript_11545/g.36677 Transcript_11545/m.36677 type:complete len:366 (+) Transcript_11545:1054-2151(+)